MGDADVLRFMRQAKLNIRKVQQPDGQFKTGFFFAKENTISQDDEEKHGIEE